MGLFSKLFGGLRASDSANVNPAMHHSRQLDLKVSGPRDGLDLYVNNEVIGKQTPSIIRVEVGDLIWPHGIQCGAWVVQGEEEHIEFMWGRSDGLATSIHASTGKWMGFIGYMFKEVSQQEFDMLVAVQQTVRVIDAIQTPIHSLNALRRHPELWVLDISMTAVTDVSPLFGVSDLRWLNIRGTQIPKTDVRSLETQFPRCILLSDH